MNIQNKIIIEIEGQQNKLEEKCHELLVKINIIRLKSQKWWKNNIIEELILEDVKMKQED